MVDWPLSLLLLGFFKQSTESLIEDGGRCSKEKGMILMLQSLRILITFHLDSLIVTFQENDILSIKILVFPYATLLDSFLC